MVKYLVYWGIIAKFAIEPHDARCLGGGLTPGIGRFVYI